jgi:hypothetical protein
MNLKNQKKIHIVALAVLQLLLFTFPLVVKTSHYHKQVHHSSHTSELSQYEKHCAVCQFEFETLIKTELPIICGIVASLGRITSEYLSSFRSKDFAYVSLRAPPRLLS